MEIWHQHLIVNAIVTNSPSTSNCKSWLDDLVPKINMSTLVEATTVECYDPGNEGITGVIIITTSHAAFHYWNKHSLQPNRLSFCLYSCSKFQPEVVLDYIDDFWTIERHEVVNLDRNWKIRRLSNSIKRTASY